MVKHHPSFIDLFSGAGGLSQGFVSQGFTPLFANDHEKPALETYLRNHPGTIVTSQDVETIDPSDVRKSLGIARGALDVLLGGPPCQGFSTYGQRNPEDKRNQLYLYFIAFLEEFRPKAFVLENVIGLLSIEQGRVIDDIVGRIDKLNYGVTVNTLDAVDFGVPQFRNRVFVTGAAARQKIETPKLTHSSAVKGIKTNPNEKQHSFFVEENEEALEPIRTVRDAISDLPEKVFTPRLTHQSIPYPKTKEITQYQAEMRQGSTSLFHHAAKQMLGVRRLRLTLMRPGDYGTNIRERIKRDGLPDEVIDELLSGEGGLRDVNQVRSEDRVKEQELRDMLQKGHVDPNQLISFLDSGGFANKYRRLVWDSPSHTLVAHMARDCSDFVHPEIDRFITVREAARLQSFPDTFIFPGSQFQQLRQIGNAVPPKLGAALAREIRGGLGFVREVAS